MPGLQSHLGIRWQRVLVRYSDFRCKIQVSWFVSKLIRREKKLGVFNVAGENGALEWGYRLATEQFPSMHRALGSIPSTAQGKKRRQNV